MKNVGNGLINFYEKYANFFTLFIHMLHLYSALNRTAFHKTETKSGSSSTLNLSELCMSPA